MSGRASRDKSNRLERALVHALKCRGDGFHQLYTWLDGADLLIVRADRSEPLVVIPLRLAVEIAKTAKKERRPAHPSNRKHPTHSNHQDSKE
jgi:hypothetical protein